MAMNPRLLRPTSGNDSPASIPGLALWLDAAAPDALYQNSDGTVPATAPGDPVGYWRDRSGNGRHATQSTAASRPVVGSQNGRKALTFDGSNDFMSADAAAAVFAGTDTPWTVLAAIDMNSTANSSPWAASRNDAFAGRYLARVVSNTWNHLFTDDSGVNKAIATGTPVSLDPSVLTVIKQGATASISVLGATVLSGADASGTATPTTFTVGAHNNLGGVTSYSSLNALEVLAYSRALSTAERRKVEVYLARRWGITLAPQVSNAEAQDWINRVYANGGTVSTSTASAVSTFCDAIDAAGIRDRFYRLNLFCGDNLNAALVPLYRGPTFGGTTYGNATDTNNGPFVSGDYSLASGLWPGASNSSKYLNTGYKANTLAASNTHMGLGLLATNTINSSFRTGLGAFSGSSNSLEVILHSAVSGARCASFTRFGTATDTAGDVVFNASLTAGSIVAAWPTVYRDGVATGTDATTSQDYPSAHDMFVFANSSGGVTPINYSNPRLGYYSIGATMTSAQALAYSTAMSAFYSAIGRS